MANRDSMTSVVCVSGSLSLQVVAYVDNFANVMLSAIMLKCVV